MRTKIEWNGKTIEVSSRYVGYDTPFCGGYRKHHFKVTVAVQYEGGQRGYISDYWQPEKKIRPYDLRCALECYCSDATSADMSVQDFSEEFGYKNTEKCFRVYNACREALVNFKHMGIDPYELGNYLERSMIYDRNGAYDCSSIDEDPFAGL